MAGFQDWSDIKVGDPLDQRVTKLSGASGPIMNIQTCAISSNRGILALYKIIALQMADFARIEGDSAQITFDNGIKKKKHD